MRSFVFAMLLFASRSVPAQLIYETVWVDYDSAWQYKSLQLIPIRPRDPGISGPATISLSQALRQGIASISERGTASTENVHWLRLNNNSDKTIYIGAGETFSGGRQDRMVTRDTLLTPTGRDQYIPVMCIEEGRWSEKEKKIQYNNYADVKLRKVLDRFKNQVLVWKEILSQLDSAAFNSSTFAYNALKQSKPYQLEEEKYLKYFLDKFRSSDSSIAGFVCISGSRVIGSDIFADKQMFFDQLEPLLSGYISEAIRRGSEPALSKEEIKLYMDQVLTNETLQNEFCKKNGKIFRADNKVIHVTSY